MLNYSDYNPGQPPVKPTKPILDPWKEAGVDLERRREEYLEAMRKYEHDMDMHRLRVRSMNATFKDDCLKDCGLIDHPRAEAAWLFALDQGNDGRADVHYYLTLAARVLGTLD